MEKWALEGARRPSAGAVAYAHRCLCVRTCGIGTPFMNTDGLCCASRPMGRWDSTKRRQLWGSFRGLGSFSCKRSFLLEECSLRATISVVSKDWMINLRDGRTLLTLLCRLDVFSVERQWRLDRSTFGRSSFGFERSGLLSSLMFCGYWR